jgi:anti-sigma factor RsiW
MSHRDEVIPPVDKTASYKGETYITCEEVISFLLAYLTGELAPEKVVDFERHLAICPSCVAYLRTYQDAVALGKASLKSSPPEAPAALGADLVRAILDARQR